MRRQGALAPAARRSAVASLACSCVALALAGPAAAVPDPFIGGQSVLGKLNIPLALKLAPANLAQVPVASIDNGVATRHPDLAPRLFSVPATHQVANPGGADATVPAGAPGWDFIGSGGQYGPFFPDSDPNPPSGNGHGTIAAGIIGAGQSNGVGGAGIAPNARLVAVRACGDGDACADHLKPPVATWAAGPQIGARVVTLSWLGSEPDYEAAIAGRPNTLFVAIISGNGAATDATGQDRFPCSFNLDNVICVTTASRADGLASGDFSATLVDLATPTEPNVAPLPGNGYLSNTGTATSWASPIVGGVAAILFGMDPAATAAEVKAALMAGTRAAPAWQGKTVTGGILDAAGAVRAFAQARGIPLRTPTGNPAELPGGGIPGVVPTGNGAPADTSPPGVKVGLTKSRFRPGRKGARLAAKAPTTLKVYVSERARVTITLERKVRRKWRKGGTLRLGTLSRGTTRRGFSGLTRRGRRLTPGSWRLKATAVDAAGNRGRSEARAFRLLQPKQRRR